MLCRSGTGYFETKIELAQVLNAPLPQISITMQTMIHGSNALHSSLWVSGVSSIGFGVAMVAADSSLPRKAGDSHNCFGCHTFRNRIRQPIEISDAPMST